MLQGAWTIVEMRGPSIFSLLCIIGLLGYLALMHIKVNKLEDALCKAKEDIYKGLGTDITKIKTDVGKLAESSRSTDNILNNIQKDMRQMREINSRN